MNNMEFDIREYIKVGFERLEAKLDAMSEATNANNQNIALLQSKHAQIEKDVNALGNNNRTQHLEFYHTFKELTEQINKADLIELKSDVKKHDSELDKLSGAFKIAAWVIGFIFSAIGVFLSLR